MLKGHSSSFQDRNPPPPPTFGFPFPSSPLARAQDRSSMKAAGPTPWDPSLQPQGCCSLSPHIGKFLGFAEVWTPLCL